MIKLRKFSFLIILFLFFSCSQNLDFDQTRDIELKPSFTSALTYFKLKANSFPLGTTEVAEETAFEVFKGSFFTNNLVRLEFNYEVVNSFNRDFTIEITLYDDDNSPVYFFKDLNILANQLDFKQDETIEIKDNLNARNFSKVGVVVKLDDPSMPVTAMDVGDIDFKSAIKIYIEKDL